LLANARRTAVSKMIFQARFILLLLYSFFCYGEPTRTRLIEFLHYFEYGIHTADVAVRAIEAAIPLVYRASVEDSREVFVGYADAGVGFAVL